MTAFADVTLVNQAAANVVFSPAGIDPNGVALWLTNDSIFDARYRLSQQMLLPRNGARNAKLTERIVIPVMDPVQTSLKVGEVTATLSVSFPKEATLTNRQDMRKLLYTLLGHTITVDAFEKFQSQY